MNSFPLSIRYAETPQRDTVAWLTPGDDPRAWFAEWAIWQLPLVDSRVARIPGLGAMTILAGDQRPTATSRALPLGRVGWRLYLPTHAQLLPPASAREIDDLLPDWADAALLYPGQGLLLFEAEELLPLARLLIAPDAVSSDWTAAEVGPACNDRLFRLQPTTHLDAQTLLRDAGGDIGSQSGTRQLLPPRPNEPGSGLLDSVVRTAISSVAGLALSVARGLGDGKPAPQGGRKVASVGAAEANWLARLAGWAKEQLDSRSRQLDELRNREVLRLMHLLEKNPDEGLKFAIGFNNSDSSRGRGRAGGYLDLHEVNFNLGRLGGGGAADYWNLSAEHQQRLRARYRELALREIEMGRHRRAAYIFGELLADLEAAAGALKTGQHWREAATLYNDRLNKPLFAAECLENGRLFHEAIQILTEMKQFERAGDLHLQVGEADEATIAWRLAADQFLQAGELTEAARVLEDKLRLPDEALAALDAGWNVSQSKVLVSATFALLARLGRHEESRRRIVRLRDATNTLVTQVEVASSLAAISQAYPDALAGQLAADAVRVVAARHLKQVIGPMQLSLVRAVQDAAPGDALLGRDCQRFLRKEPPTAVPVSSKQRKKSQRGRKSSNETKPKLLKKFYIPLRSPVGPPVVASGNGYLLIASAEERQPLPEIIRASWDGVLQHAQVVGPGQFGGRTCDLHSIDVDRRGGSAIVLGLASGSADFTCRFGEHSSFDGAESIVPFAPSRQSGVQLRGLTYGPSLLHVALQDVDGEVRIDSFPVDRTGRFGPLHASVVCPFGGMNIDIPLYRSADGLIAAYGSSLFYIAAGQVKVAAQLNGAASDLIGSAPFARSRIVASTAKGGCMLWLDRPLDDSSLIHFAEDLTTPRVALTQNGYLIAAAENGVEVYQTRDGQIVLSGSLPALGERPLAVLPTSDGNQFAIVTSALEVRVYEVSR